MVLGVPRPTLGKILDQDCNLSPKQRESLFWVHLEKSLNEDLTDLMWKDVESNVDELGRTSS